MGNPPTLTLVWVLDPQTGQTIPIPYSKRESQNHHPPPPLFFSINTSDLGKSHHLLLPPSASAGEIASPSVHNWLSSARKAALLGKNSTAGLTAGEDVPKLGSTNTACP